MFALDTSNFQAAVQAFETKHADFIEGYYRQVLNIAPNDPRKLALLFNYVNYEGAKAMQDSLQKNPIDFKLVQEQLNDLAAFHKYYFPQDSLGIQKAYTYFSDFSSDRGLGDGFVALPLDMTMGEGFAPYSFVKIPMYQQRTLTDAHLVSKAAMALATVYVEDSVKAPSSIMINRMLHEAKKYYLADLLLPTVPDTLMFGFSAYQMEYCKNGERALYEHLAEAEMFYSSKEIDYLRYINQGPFNPSLNMPGNSGTWLGYRIILSYVNYHRETLKSVIKDTQELDRKLLKMVMDENDPQVFLNLYKPAK